MLGGGRKNIAIGTKTNLRQLPSTTRDARSLPVGVTPSERRARLACCKCSCTRSISVRQLWSPSDPTFGGAAVAVVVLEIRDSRLNPRYRRRRTERFTPRKGMITETRLALDSRIDTLVQGDSVTHSGTALRLSSSSSSSLTSSSPSLLSCSPFNGEIRT